MVNGWIAEGRAEREIGARRAAAIAVLEARFGSVPGEVVAAITANADAAQLQTWLALAARAADLAAFRAAAGIQ